MQHAYSIYIQEAAAKSNIAVATHIQIVKRVQAVPNAVFILTVHSLEIAPCNTSKIREDSWHFFQLILIHRIFHATPTALSNTSSYRNHSRGCSEQTANFKNLKFHLLTFTELQTAQQLPKLLRGAGCIQKHRSTLTSSWAISSISHILTEDPFVGTTTFPRLGRKPCRRFLLGDDFRNFLSRSSLLAIRGHAAISIQSGMLLLVPDCLLSTKASSVLHPGTYLSVRALLCVSLAAWRSSSSRLLSVSSLSTSPRVHFLGLINRISFKSSSFSLINMRRSRSESSTPGQASLSSLASCIFRFAILKKK